MEGQATDNWIGRKLGGRYLILESIGEGGMGVVYRAKQLSIDREVAVKMMHNRAAQDPQWTDRFQSEAKACSLLTHPNTIRLYDFGQTTLGNFYMVMELLGGRSLTDVITAEAPMAPARVLRILMQVCASLAEAHKNGIIHRDIKPENIFVQEFEGASDFIKLFDFSIAKRSDVAMTATGIIMGTPQFMSPEQGRGEGIDLRSDLYSVGVVAYAMLAGRLPFHHEDPLEVLRMHQSHTVPPLPQSVPSSVAKVVMSCLEKDPAGRPASAIALLEAAKIWLTVLDPSLDVGTDPILKNTLVTGEPTMVPHEPSPAPTPSTPRTMLGASGAVKIKPLGTAVTQPAEQPVSNSTFKTLIHGNQSEPVLSSESQGSAPRPRPASSRLTKPEFSSSQREAPPQVESPQGEPPASFSPRRGSEDDPSLPEIAAQPAPTNSYPPEIPSEIDLPAAPGKAGFFVLCLLVALTFGFGSFFLVQTLR